MERKTKLRPEPIEVCISRSGFIRVSQSDPDGVYTNTGEVVVVIDTDDAEQIANWILEVKKEILEERANGETFEISDDDSEDNKEDNKTVNRNANRKM